MNLAILPRWLPRLQDPPTGWVSTSGVPRWVHEDGVQPLGAMTLPWGTARLYLAPWGLGLLQWRGEGAGWRSVTFPTTAQPTPVVSGLAHRLAHPPSWLQRRRRARAKASRPTHTPAAPDEEAQLQP